MGGSENSPNTKVWNQFKRAVKRDPDLQGLGKSDRRAVLVRKTGLSKSQIGRYDRWIEGEADRPGYPQEQTRSRIYAYIESVNAESSIGVIRKRADKSIVSEPLTRLILKYAQEASGKESRDQFREGLYLVRRYSFRDDMINASYMRVYHEGSEGVLRVSGRRFRYPTDHPTDDVSYEIDMDGIVIKDEETRKILLNARWRKYRGEKLFSKGEHLEVISLFMNTVEQSITHPQYSGIFLSHIGSEGLDRVPMATRVHVQRIGDLTDSSLKEPVLNKLCCNYRPGDVICSKEDLPESLHWLLGQDSNSEEYLVSNHADEKYSKLKVVAGNPRLAEYKNG